MVSILKNQLLKHLSRFTKNLSADKINLSTFRGEGELTNLELNEIVLTDLLELPTWLRLQSAWCNRVSFRIQWTQLKKVPIVLSLDEVNIIVETCEELRTINLQSPTMAAIPGKYSFIHKIIDGITVHVNTVLIIFNSPAFTANVQINKIVLESKNPKWKKADLRSTRIKEPEKGQLLIFKELEWQNVRIEAKSTVDKNLYPLRLLANEARCRITIKKRLSDSFILGSRLVIILNSLIWVLTDSQLKAALHFLDSLAGLVQRATELTRKTKAARKLEELPEYRAHQAQQQRVNDNGNSESAKKIFSQWDVIETSYHFVAQAIDLHLCDDPGPGRSLHSNLKKGGALRVSLQHFQIDFYPYHMAILDRRHWPTYKESCIPHVQWQEQSLNSFRLNFLELLKKNQLQQLHTPLSRATKFPEKQNSSNINQSPKFQERRSSASLPSSPTHSEDVMSFAMNQMNKMMTSCMVIRIEDFTVYKVTTSEQKQSLKECITGDRCQKNLPVDAKMVHAEFTYFYYPNDIPFPLPAPKFYVQLNPINIIFDLDTCLWFNSFALNLHQSLLDSKQDMSGSNLTYIDVKIEAIMPKLIFESYKDYIIQRDRPKSLSFLVTRATITNVRSVNQSSRADLAKCVDSFHMGSLFFGSEFPSKRDDFYVITQKFMDHINAKDNIRTQPKELDSLNLENFISQLNKEFMWIEAKDVWCINLDPVYGNFIGARASNKPIPFLDAVPITVWLHSNLDPNSTIASGSGSYADIHALAHISNLVSIQLNHYQYLFLLRLAEDATELSTYLALDSNRIKNVQENNASLVLGALIPQVEVTFVMPSAYPGKESSGGDVESFIPESSLADDIIDQKGSLVWNSNLTISSVSPQQSGHKTMHPKSPTNNLNISETSAHFDVNNIGKRSMSVSPNENTPIISDAQIMKQQSISTFTNAGFSSMKKGFNSLMTSIDSAFKPSVDDASDTMSIRSDQSSDSETYVLLSLEQDQRIDDQFVVYEFAEQVKSNIEAATEVTEEESTVTTTSDHSLTSSCRRKDLVCVSTFKLTKVEFLQQSYGFSSAIKVQVGGVSNEDCNSIPWDEFQCKFATRSRVWSDNPGTSSTSPQVKLRMDHDVINLPSINQLHTITRTNIKSYFKDFLDVQINDVDINLSMSTVAGMADLVEDECIPTPKPMEVSIKNVFLHLNEDRPPVNITSPGPVPINLRISELFIKRDLEGVFCITPKVVPTVHQPLRAAVENKESDKTNRQLRSDNEELRRRLAAFERISEENRLLRKSREETELLKSTLSKSQEDMARLLEEKRRLLDEIRKLQETRMSDGNRQWGTNKR